MIPFQFIVPEWVVSCERKRCYAIIFIIWLHLFSKNYHFFLKKKMMRILNSFHAANYITLKEKIFSTRYVIFFNQNGLLNEICFVFLLTYEI